MGIRKAGKARVRPGAVAVLFLLGSGFLPAPGWGANRQSAPPIRFRHLTSEDGLSQSAVNCILQDRQGRMWFGTESGLDRYDGSSITVFEPKQADPNSLGNNFINCLLEDRQGFIWVGTERGLDRFDPDTGRFVHFVSRPDDPSSLSGDRVFKVLEDRSGRIWVGTDKGLSRLDPGSGRFLRYAARPEDPAGLSHNEVRCLCEDRAGGLWLGTYGGGLCRLDAARREFTRYNHAPGRPASLSDDYVLSVLQDHSGVIWVGTRSGGLNKLDGSSGRFEHFSTDPLDPRGPGDAGVNCLYEDAAGRLWVGTNTAGLSRLDRDTGTFVGYRRVPEDPASLNDNRVLSVFRDQGDVLWVGTYNGGLNISAGRSESMVHCLPDPRDPAGLSSGLIRSFGRDDQGFLWVGTDGRGVDVLDRDFRKVRHFQSVPGDPRSLGGNRIFSIQADPSGFVWVGTYGGGLSRYDPRTKAFRTYRFSSADRASLSDDRIRAVHVGRAGTIWVGTDGGGLCGLDPRTGRFRRYRNDPGDPHSLANDRVWSIVEDPRGVLWLGTFGGGLDLFDPSREEFSGFRAEPNRPDGISSDYVITLFLAPDGIIWIGTNGGGLCRFDPKRKGFSRIGRREGLASDIIYGVLGDAKGNIWLSSGRGISRYDPSTGRVKNFDVASGLQGYEFNGGSCARAPDGRMFFGGINGFNAFYPEDLKDNPRVPPVLITDFQLSGRSVPVGPGPDGRTILSRDVSRTPAVRLSHRDRSISFEFAALDYSDPDKNQYTWRMENFDREWTRASDRNFASYTNLPAGDYVFRVKGSNNDGVWNEAGASLRITVMPPFWQTLVFRVLALVAFLGATGGLFNLRVRRLKGRKAELEAQVRERTAQLAEANHRLEVLAVTDGLTGIANFRRMGEFLALEWRRAFRYKYPVSILIIDVDDFKAFNDTYGHQAGDECLVKIAGVLATSCRRPGDLAARYGGEEFLLTLSDTNGAGALVVAELIRTGIESLGIRHENSRAADRVTVSIGCATGRPASMLTPAALIEAADKALYKAKKAGRNRVISAEIPAAPPAHD